MESCKLIEFKNAFLFIISQRRIEKSSDFVDFNSELCHVLALCHYPVCVDPFNRINFRATDTQSVRNKKS